MTDLQQEPQDKQKKGKKKQKPEETARTGRFGPGAPVREGTVLSSANQKELDAINSKREENARKLHNIAGEDFSQISEAERDKAMEEAGKLYERDILRFVQWSKGGAAGGNYPVFHADGSLEFQDGTVRRPRGGYSPPKFVSADAEPIKKTQPWFDNRREDYLYADSDRWRMEQGLPTRGEVEASGGQLQITLSPFELQEFAKFEPYLPQLIAAGIVSEEEVMSMPPAPPPDMQFGSGTLDASAQQGPPVEYTMPVPDPAKWRTTEAIKSWVFHRNNLQMNARYGTTDPSLWDHVKSAYKDINIVMNDGARAFAIGMDDFFTGAENITRKVVEGAITYSSASPMVWPDSLKEFAAGKSLTMEESGIDPLTHIYSKVEMLATGRFIQNDEYLAEQRARRARADEWVEQVEAMRSIADQDRDWFDAMRAIGRGTGSTAQFFFGGPMKSAMAIERLFGVMGTKYLASRTAQLAISSGVKAEVLMKWMKSGTLLTMVPRKLAQDSALRSKMLQVMSKTMPMGNKMIGMGGMAGIGSGGDPAEAGMMALMTPGFIMMSKFANFVGGTKGLQALHKLPRDVVVAALEGTGFTAFDYHTYSDLIQAYGAGDMDGVKKATLHLLGTAAGWTIVKTAGASGLIQEFRRSQTPSATFARIAAAHKPLRDRVRDFLREELAGNEERGEIITGPEGDKARIDAKAKKTAAGKKAYEAAEKGKKGGDPEEDILAAMARLGGVNKADMMNFMGVGENDIKKIRGKGSGIMHPFTTKGKSMDAMAESLAQDGWFGEYEAGHAGKALELFERALGEALGGVEVLNPRYSGEFLAKEAEAERSRLHDEQVEYEAQRLAEENPDAEIDAINRKQQEVADEWADQFFRDDVNMPYPEQRAVIIDALGAGWQPKPKGEGSNEVRFSFGNSSFTVTTSKAGELSLRPDKKLAEAMGWEDAPMTGEAAYSAIGHLTRSATLSSQRMRNKVFPPESGWVRSDDVNVFFHPEHGYYTERHGVSYLKSLEKGSRWHKMEKGSEPAHHTVGDHQTPTTVWLTKLIAEQHTSPGGSMDDAIRIGTAQQALIRLTNPQSLDPEIRRVLEDPSLVRLLTEVDNDQINGKAVDMIGRILANERDATSSLMDFMESVAILAPEPTGDIDFDFTGEMLGEADQVRYESMVGEMKGSKVDVDTLAEFDKLSVEDKAKWLDIYDERLKWHETEGQEMGGTVDPHGAARASASSRMKSDVPTKEYVDAQAEVKERELDEYEKELEAEMAEEAEWRPGEGEGAGAGEPPAGKPPAGGKGGKGGGDEPPKPEKEWEDFEGGPEYMAAKERTDPAKGKGLYARLKRIVGQTDSPIEQIVRDLNEAMNNKIEAEKYRNRRFQEALEAKPKHGGFGKKLMSDLDLVSFMQNTGNAEHHLRNNKGEILQRDTIEDVKRRLASKPDGKRVMKWVEDVARPMHRKMFKQKVARGEMVEESEQEFYLSQMWEVQDSSAPAHTIQRYATRSLQQKMDFSKMKKIPNYAEGIEMGLIPKTTNVAEIMRMYMDQFAITNAHQDYLNALKSIELPTLGPMRTKSGAPMRLLMAMSSPRAKQMKYSPIDHPALRYTFKGTDRIIQFGVPAEAYKQMDMYLKTHRRGKVGQAVAAIGGGMKQAALSVSGFHFMALIESSYMFGAKRTEWNPKKPFSSMVEFLTENIPAVQGVKSFMRGREYIKDVAKITGMIESGLQVGRTKDIEHGPLYEGLQKIIDLGKITGDEGWLAKVAKTGAKYSISPIATALKSIKKVNDKFLWDYTHTYLKVDAFDGLSEQMLKGVTGEREIARVRRDVAQIVNDAFGGQNWATYHRVSSGALQKAQALMLSIDWTVSNARIAARGVAALTIDPALKAAGKEPLSTTSAKSRAYALRAAALMTVAVDAMQQALLRMNLDDEKVSDLDGMTDRERYLNAHGSFHVYDNPAGRRFGYICYGYDANGKEKYFGVLKQVKEATDYIPDRDGSAIDVITRKLSPLVHTAAEQGLGYDTLGRDMPHKKEKTIMGSGLMRLWEIVLKGSPFALRGGLEAIRTGSLEKMGSVAGTWPRASFTPYLLALDMQDAVAAYAEGELDQKVLEGLAVLGYSNRMKSGKVLGKALEDAREPLMDELKARLLDDDHEGAGEMVKALTRLGLTSESAEKMLATWYAKRRDKGQLLPDLMSRGLSVQQTEKDWIKAFVGAFHSGKVLEKGLWLSQWGKALRKFDKKIEEHAETRRKRELLGK